MPTGSWKNKCDWRQFKCSSNKQWNCNICTTATSTYTSTTSKRKINQTRVSFLTQPTKSINLFNLIVLDLIEYVWIFELGYNFPSKTCWTWNNIRKEVVCRHLHSSVTTKLDHFIVGFVILSTTLEFVYGMFLFVKLLVYVHHKIMMGCECRTY